MKIQLLEHYDEAIVAQIYSIHCQKLGAGYMSPRDYIEIIKNKNLLIATQENRIVGFLYFYICKEKEFIKQKNLSLFLKTSSEEVLVLNTCAVEQERSGVGTKLTKFCIDNFGKEISKIYSPVWKYGEVIHADRLLKKLGLDPVVELKDFWFEESLGVQNFCPICNNPCHCSMVVYCKPNKSIDKNK